MLGNLVQQPTERQVELVRRLVRAVLNLGTNLSHAILADLGQIAGLSNEVGFGRNIQLIDSGRSTPATSTLAWCQPVRRINRLGGVNLVRTVNVHRGSLLRLQEHLWPGPNLVPENREQVCSR